MYKYILAAAFVSGWVYAQTCIVPAPVKPPSPVEFIVKFSNPDGGARPCTGQARVPNGVTPSEYNLSNAKCDQAMDIAKLAAAKDNGWDDGGTP